MFLVSAFQDSIPKIVRYVITIGKLFEIFFQNYPAFEIHLLRLWEAKMNEILMSNLSKLKWLARSLYEHWLEVILSFTKSYKCISNAG
jgi:hypothetical protein